MFITLQTTIDFHTQILPHITMNKENSGNEETQVDEQVEHLIQTNPKVTYILNNKHELVNYQGFWHLCLPHYLKTILLFQSHFRARNTDIIIASFPKTGTTWLKSLLFSVVNRFNYPKTETPLLKHHPHELVYRLEADLYGNVFEYPHPHHLDQLPSPRLFSTHLPYTSLPESITNSGCRILYISRNPFDTFVSYYLFAIESMKKRGVENYVAPSMEEMFEDYCAGRIVCGPFFDHVVGYKKKSLEQTDKVLFLQYEDLKDDTVLYVKKLAEFVGMPFSAQEENEGVVEDIVRFCSIQNLKELEVNKSGVFNKWFEKKSYFRKGEVGDWIHHFTPSMVEKMNKLMEENLAGTGLSFRMV